MIDLLVGAAVETASTDTDREWAAARPDRSVSAVREAVTPPSGWGAFAACVEQRESGGSPTALNASGAAGLFQFMPAWRSSLPYIVAERLKQFGASKRQAKSVRVYLQGVGRVEKYPALYQRIAFAEVLDDGAWQHWTLRGSRCEGLVP